jgi:predicted molibdopterin-dependent oxidoreductase YjgC
MTETAKIAHVVLPASSFVEKRGTFTNLERRVQKLNPLRSPIGQSKSDFDIFLFLLRLLEYPVPGETEDAIFEEICRLVPYYQNVQDGEQWPNGSPCLYSDGFPIGRAKLLPVDGKNAYPKIEGFPFQLIQRPSLFQSGLLSSKSDALKIVSEKPYLEIHPEDARLLKIDEGEAVQVSTQAGRSLRMNVKYSSKPVPGVITAPYPCPLVSEGGVAPAKIESFRRGGD